ncbi:6-hydroxymethylpterin diphosphokinase MptE-like protein [Phaeobacter gallaeciensis]|uniref:6-hydroxymethylpterin diphosphokinase MptE-like protein n=1 Tax=Phaeobacter gallaeciensis TaxID=60890 RepID=UPI00237F52B6|nr:6-hydroxymethylpterin diphosphokinase MptE-like protein [Phaeobacter gallaeciensis]MDE4193120.1 DUF115 domain-containing protein [Phaeobacter gallaeciensis]MDE4201439.1 DUF115 domain-containing protein [Phaeobacter gallaeciensis]MDE4205619.1 DUF115 domain-containing protein [Phaeobacter gallaeciensis]MDE4209796.1 DUF115 domain-containing protein [Phaeobacter gallaeciensis]MDE4218165.1 DUF115 domain-containing protein [Phaeobacter gallaeciensis]
MSNLVRGTGISYRLQGYDPVAPVNAFDPGFWLRCTGLADFGVELYVSVGTVSVSLRQHHSNGSETELARLNTMSGGSAFSPPIQTDNFDGYIVPVVMHADEDAVFDLYFGTNSKPYRESAKITFVIEGNAKTLAETQLSFIDFMGQLPADHPAQAHLVLISTDSDAGLVDEAKNCPEISIISDLNTAGIGSIGRGLYAVAYGEISIEAPSHLCLMEGAISAPSPALFERSMSLAQFQNPQWIFSPPFSGDQPLGWNWILCDLHRVYRSGLAYPFLGRYSGVEYRSRLIHMGSCDEAIAPGLWCPAQENTSSDPVCDWISQTLSGTFPSAPQDPNLQEDWATFNRGPYAAIEKLMLRQGFPLPPRPDFFLRLRRKVLQLKEFLGVKRARIKNSVNLASRYHQARSDLATTSYWRQCSADVPPLDPFFASRSKATHARAEHSQNTVRALREMELVHRVKTEFSSKLSYLEQNLQRAHLWDADRVRADQDRANRIVLGLLRNRHAGQRAVIVGNGPSLRIQDLEHLKGAVTFGSNKIFLAYEETEWRPDYYSVEDHMVMLNNRTEIARLEGSFKIFPENLRDFNYHKADTLFVPVFPANRENPLSDPEFPHFSHDLTQGIGWGSTIVYSQIQMALFMGCAEIVIIGLDHKYVLPATKTGNAYRAAGERNHFHPKYRSSGELWHQPNLKVLEVSYAKAKKACDTHGVRIFNASRKTELQIFERAEFDDLFPSV